MNKKDIDPDLIAGGWDLDWHLHDGWHRKLKLLWNSLKWKLKDIYYAIMNFPRFVKRVYEYLPVLYNDVDYDYTSILTMLAYKCKRTRQYIEVSGHLANKERVCRELRTVELLVDRIVGDNYCESESLEMETKYGSLNLLSRRCTDNDSIASGCKEILFTREKCIGDKKLIAQEREETTRIYRKADSLKQHDYDLLFKHIRKHIQSWWD